MAEVIKNIFGGSQPKEPVVQRDLDFADFAAAPNPVPEAMPGTNTLTGANPEFTGRPYTKWYRIHERHSLSDFKAEGVILAIATLIFIFHFFGARSNRSKSRAWIKANSKALRDEFALVGFDRKPNLDADFADPNTLLKEKSLFEFSTYASGRQNTAFMDVNIVLTKKFNPLINIFETVAGYLSDSFGTPENTVEAFIYPFDGKESLTVPRARGAVETEAVKDARSTYDGFVWAIVNKSCMQKLRDDRYDVSLTATKDHSKLPNWLTVMSESAEITDALLTPELIDLVTSAGELFDYLIVSDQPNEKPQILDDTVPRKRLFLKYHLPSDDNYENLAPLFAFFLRLPDMLVTSAHFRPEVLKKVRSVREQRIAQIRKLVEEERAEERLADKEKAKKAKRDAELKGLDAKAQKRYLEKEREKDLRKSQKKMTMRG